MLIISRRRFLPALIFILCIVIGIGFVMSRRAGQEDQAPDEVPGEILNEAPVETQDKTLDEISDEIPYKDEVTERVATEPGIKMPVFYVDTKENAVALTFDISWGEQQVLGVLDILREENVKSTFFLSGPWAKRYPHLAQEIERAGHDIGSHGDAHVDLSNYSRAEIAENISTAHDDLLASAGRVSPYFRPPNGDYNTVVLDTARSLGYETVIWAVDSLDWKNPGVDFMVDRVLKRVFPGAIILMHASDSSKQIQDALPLVIGALRKEGFRLIPLSELSKLGPFVRWDPR
ncbi:MAG: polysaccharide deacetylase family protein [Firmicutes bacterium]|nr:polysaccharide deacetylase family protein [Bacillota bacterium]